MLPKISAHLSLTRIALLAAASTLVLAAPQAAIAGELPTGTNSFAMVMKPSQELDAYQPVDLVCFAPTGNYFLALTNGGRDGEEGAATLVSARRDGRLEETIFALGEAVSGAEEITIPYTVPRDAELFGELAFSTDGGSESAVSGITKIGLRNGYFPCQTSSDVVYFGVSNDRKMMVTADEQGALSLTMMDGASVLLTIEGGVYATGSADENVFLFMEAERLITIRAAPHDRQTYPSWTITQPNRPAYLSSPKAFVSADMHVRGEAASMVPYALSLHLERLDTCLHLAGEWSGVASRDSEVRSSRDQAGCDNTRENQAAMRVEYADNPAITAILNSRRLEQ